MRRANVSALLLFFGLILLVGLTGCSEKEEYTLSPRVKALWDKYPSPWDSATANQAVDEAFAMLEKYPRDYQLARYTMERMEGIDPVGLAAEFERIHLARPDDPRWMVLDALVNSTRDEQFDRTKEALEKAPDDPYLMIEHARSILNRRPVILEEATDLAFRAVDVAENLPDANGMLAYILLWVGQPQQALDFAQHAVSLDPNEFAYVENEALILSKLGRREEGIALMEAFQAAHPRNPDAIKSLLDRYLGDRSWDKMIPLKRLAAQNDEGNGMTWVELALVYQRLDLIDSTFSSLFHAADAGFFDQPFLEFAFEEDLTDLQANPQYRPLIRKLEETRTATAEQRRREALADPLDLLAPDLDAVALEGYPVKLTDLRGKTVILGFWSTWSGWAKITEPRLMAFYKRLPSDVEFVSINVLERIEPEKRAELVERYVKDRKLPWANWLADDVTATRFGVQALPSYLVIDSAGKIRYHVIGYAPYIDEVLGWMIDSLSVSGN